jgi:putative DNA base modification enzyme with NMAD domain
MMLSMRAYLVRVGIDQAFGGWNAPVDPCTNEFVYVPIPEGSAQRAGLATPYEFVGPALARFAETHPDAPPRTVQLPAELARGNMHLDPDFGALTYGDTDRRGRGLADLEAGDLVVFYAGLRPVSPCPHALVYALIGLHRVAEVVRLETVPAVRWNENAHTRRSEHRPRDVIVRGDRRMSGRLRTCLPIGEFRDRAYRVTRDVLDTWGGLSCRDGYLQRSAVPPRILDPVRFLAWFERCRPQLVSANNP